MKQKLLIFNFLSLMLAISIMGCNKYNEIDLKGDVSMLTAIGKLKLTGIIDVKTNKSKVLEPNDYVECYTLAFNMDGTYWARSSTNDLGGTYEANSVTNSIRIIGLGGTKVGEVDDGTLWRNVFPTIKYFSLQDNELRLYYNNNKNYLLYKSLEK